MIIIIPHAVILSEAKDLPPDSVTGRSFASLRMTARTFSINQARCRLMKTIPIRARDAAFQKFEVLKTNRNKRHRYGEFFVEGVRNLNEAVRNGWAVRSFLYARDEALSNWAKDMLRDVRTDTNYELPKALMDELSGKDETSELLAVVAMRDELDASRLMGKQNPVFALFDRPSNKGNLGTLIRSCDALGVSGLIITGHAVDIYEPDVVSSSMGSFFGVPFVRLSDNQDIDRLIAQLKAEYPGLKVVGTTAHRQVNLFDVDMTGPVLLMVGNETDGLNRHLVETADVMATIPMSPAGSASSFNVSCAATVMFYEAVRQRATL